MDQILQILNGNARMDTEKMAVMLGISAEEVQAKISAYEKEGIIRGYKPLLDYDKIDTQLVEAIIEVRVSPQRDFGFEEIARMMEGVAAVEKEHEERYLRLAQNIEEGIVFEREGQQIWQCRNCGHIHVGSAAPEMCPVCAHPRAHFQLAARNY